tara:strand:- start:220 stop:348 length:129 start_codon:yes stop_codon:yes gene_type:complete
MRQAFHPERNRSPEVRMLPSGRKAEEKAVVVGSPIGLICLPR